MFFNSPIEQFDVYPLFSFNIFNWFNLYFTNSSFYMFSSISLLFIIFKTISLRLNFFPNNWHYFLEITYKFLFKIVDEQAGKKAYIYLPFLISLFFFLLFCNLMGQFPFGFSPTSHIIITFFFSLTIWFSCIYIGLLNYKEKWFKFFVPDTIPLAILPFFIGLEIISYIIRAFSLALRLCANMTAGHILLHLVATLGLNLINTGFLMIIVSGILLFFILFLELAVSFLQAYVFITLVVIYIKDSLDIIH